METESTQEQQASTPELQLKWKPFAALKRQAAAPARVFDAEEKGAIAAQAPDAPQAPTR